MKKMNDLPNRIIAKKNYPYIVSLVIGVIIGTYKYSFIAAIIGFSIVIVIGIIAGFVINKLTK
jgi:hypothetical protein